MRHGDGADPVGARLRAAVDAARGAGEVLLGFRGRLRQVAHKGAFDLVSEADLASEAFLRDRLLGAFPGDGFLGEENGGEPGDSGYRWVVDPLDGTLNFVHGLPYFAVSIAVEREGRVVAGAVRSPVAGETYRARAGRGAFCGRRRLQVSATAHLGDALLATGWPRDRGAPTDAVLAQVRRVLSAAQELHRDGSAALDLCRVADGMLDGYFERGLHAWDVAAGQLVVEEAGGRVTDDRGRPHDPHRGPLVATNGRLHDALLERLAVG